jgi:UDP-glucose 4-epimerase
VKSGTFMRILVTGSSGRIGRGIYGALAALHEVVGLDLHPFATTRHVSDIADVKMLREAVEGADAVIHTASLHAPHVGLVGEPEFRRINVGGTRTLLRIARDAGVKRFIYTSTTALYGDAVQPGSCTWIDEGTVPVPRTVYHRTKLEAENLAEDAASHEFVVRIIRMSRCFPEQPDAMALYRLHRGIDLRDVADAHAAALTDDGPVFRRFIASGWTPFVPADCDALSHSLRDVLSARCPDLLAEFERREWPLPAGIDRVYAVQHAYEQLGWRSRHSFLEVLRQSDERDIEVLPRSGSFADQTAE